MAPADLPSRAHQSFLDELARIRNDPRIAWRARRAAGDLWEDALQETYYAIAKTRDPLAIANLRAYFCTALDHTGRRMREELTSGPLPAGETWVMDTAPRDTGGPWASRPGRPAEDEALEQLTSRARLNALRRRRAELGLLIPDCSPDPARYRQAIIAVAGQVLAPDRPGPATQRQLTKALCTVYPAWFCEPSCSTAALDQRRRRGRVSVQIILAAVVDGDGDGVLAGR